MRIPGWLWLVAIAALLFWFFGQSNASVSSVATSLSDRLRPSE